MDDRLRHDVEMAVYEMMRPLPFEIVARAFHRLTGERGEIGLSREGDGSHLIAMERRRQIVECGYDAAHDDGHGQDDLSKAAACFAVPAAIYTQRTSVDGAITFANVWPWEERRRYEGFSRYGRRQQLIIAGALIAAEIDRLDRQSTTTRGRVLADGSREE